MSITTDKVHSLIAKPGGLMLMADRVEVTAAHAQAC